jgi:hypothetical protein
MELNELESLVSDIPGLKAIISTINERIKKLESQIETQSNLNEILSVEDIVSYTGFCKKTARKLINEVGKMTINRRVFCKRNDFFNHFEKFKDINKKELKIAVKATKRALRNK